MMATGAKSTPRNPRLTIPLTMAKIPKIRLAVSGLVTGKGSGEAIASLPLSRLAKSRANRFR